MCPGSARQNGGVTYAPWTQLSDDYLQAVIRARRRHNDLVHLSRDDIEIWVREAWQTPHYLDPALLPLPGAAEEAKGLTSIDYSLVVHNRRDISQENVAGIVFSLIHEADVDEFAKARVCATTDPAWFRLRHRFPAVATVPPEGLLVLAGNHRLIAQHMLGIGPYARVMRPVGWD